MRNFPNDKLPMNRAPARSWCAHNGSKSLGAPTFSSRLDKEARRRGQTRSALLQDLKNLVRQAQKRPVLLYAGLLRALTPSLNIKRAFQKVCVGQSVVVRSDSAINCRLGSTASSGVIHVVQGFPLSLLGPSGKLVNINTENKKSQRRINPSRLLKRSVTPMDKEKHPLNNLQGGS